MKKLYSEIDLLEMIKQLRVSRFMGKAFLSDNQRELIKFMKHYVLYSEKRKKVKRVKTRRVMTDET